MAELTFDAEIHDRKFRRAHGNKHFGENIKREHYVVVTSSSIPWLLSEYLWVDDDRVGALARSASQQEEENRVEEEPPQDDPLAESSQNATGESFGNVNLQIRRESNGGNGGRFHRLSEGENVEENDDLEEESPAVPHLMSEDEIMHKYWKVVSSVRLTSMAFQRWMCVLTVAVLFWTATRLVYWLSHSPSLHGIFALILPLSLLPLLASSYAEVNYEGVKVLQTVAPNMRRIHMFQYLYGMPIQLTCYGHRISYGTMGTVLAAIMAAFTSKILLQEMNKIMK